MFGSEILDVAIGLIFMFLLLSLVCTSIKEAFETVLKYRARDLARGIREMFGDTDGTGFVRLFFTHPLIDGLYRGEYNPRKTQNLPSYIPSRTFALAVLDLFRPAATTLITEADRAQGVGAPRLAEDAFLPVSFVELRNAIALSENATVRRALLPLIDSAGGDAMRARQSIEDWYNSVMDRVSGWYKRRTQIVIAVLALIIAGSMNVDTVGVTRYLNTSPTARSVIVSRLTTSTAVAKPGLTELTDPVGWLERQGGIPVGWLLKPERDQTPEDYARDWRRPPVTVGAWFIKIAGILFTAFAISLGAPFWFDILNKFMVVRSTVKPQEKSGIEPNKA